jgi:hypothetical protein
MKNCDALENQTTRRFLLIACVTALAMAFMGSLPQPARAAAVTPPPVPANLQVPPGNKPFLEGQGSAVIGSAAEETRPPGDSSPPDTSSHYRPLIPEDLVVARRAPRAVAQDVGPPFNLVRLIDVNNVDFQDGSEPSLAVSPENPNFIVVHGGFRDWAAPARTMVRPMCRATAARRGTVLPRLIRPPA